MAEPMDGLNSLVERLKQLRETYPATTPEAREENLRRLIQMAVPGAEVSDALRERIMDLEAAHTAGRPSAVFRLLRGRRSRWAMASSLAAAVIFAAIVVRPTWVAAQALRRMGAAVSDVRSAHDVTRQLTVNGNRTLHSQRWFQGNRWRLEDQKHVELYTGERLYTYEKGSNTVTIWRPEGPYGAHRSGFTMTATAGDLARWGWRDRIRLLGDTQLRGRRVLQVVIESVDEPHRVLMLVDAVTDLPIRSESQRRTDGRWVTKSVTEHEYNRTLPAALFQPDFPRSARVIDHEAGRRHWEQRLAKGIARRQVGDRTLVIRSFQVFAQGDIFVLYTAGRRPSNRLKDWSLDLSDESGTQYRNGGMFQPYVGGSRTPPNGPGYIFDGEILEGYWWVPPLPARPWQPRRFTLTFQVAPSIHHSTDRWASLPDSELSERVVFTLPVERPSPSLLPEYMPYMAFGPDERELRRARASHLAQYHRERRDLKRALEAYREILRVNEDQGREHGGPVADPQTWNNIGEVLHKLGRLTDAEQAYRRALRESGYRDSSRQDALNALAAVAAERAWSPGRKAPVVTASDLTGVKRSTDDYRKQVLLIELWSPWSVDLARRKALYAKYHSKGLAILDVGLGPDKGAVRQFVKDQHIPWPQLVDDTGWGGEIARSFGYHHPVTRLPRTILVDRRGIVRQVGLQGPALEKAVAGLLERTED